VIFFGHKAKISLKNSLPLGNVQISHDASGGGLLKQSECGHMGFGQIVINFYSGWKSLIPSSSCSIYGICEGRRLVKNAIWRERLG